jgi:hypothetical protein
MTSVTAVPLVLTNYTIQIGTDSYEKAVKGVTFTPGSPITFQGGTPTSKYSHSTDWACKVDYVQDWTTAGSLSRYLHEHEGESVEATFVPTADDDESPSFTATLAILPGVIGGQVNQFSEASVSLTCSKPELVEAP